MMSNLNSEELRSWAIVVGALVALLLFVGHLILHARHERLENVSRFIKAHRWLFAPREYVAANMDLIETGLLTRNSNDARMETKFYLMLLEVERLAILANNKAVPRQTQVFVFGWYACIIVSVFTEKERDSVS